MDNALSILQKFPRKFIFPLVLFCLGLILFGYGLIVMFSGNKTSNSQDSVIPPSPSAKAIKQSSIKIDIEGGIVHPGVYMLDSGSRIQDALVAAGGLSDLADREQVSKSVNLAAKIIDGTKIYIPFIGQPNAQSVAGASTDSSGAININTASAQELDALPGIGTITAQKIIDSRPYGTVDDLLTKKIVNSKVYGEIKDKISVY